MAAVARHNIQHPVIHDQDRSLWRLFTINAWPSFVLIDSQGRPEGRSSGEGKRLVLNGAISRSLEKGQAQGSLSPKPFMIPLAELPPSPLRFPGKIALGESGGSLYVADSGHHRILCLKPGPARGAAGPGAEASLKARLHGVIGCGRAGFMDGSLSRAEFREPQGLYCAGQLLYIADTGNHAVRQVDLQSGTVKTLAGNGEQAGWMAPGGFGPATALNSPWDLLPRDGILYIAMAGSHQIWSLDLATLQAAPFAGNGREDLVDGAPARAELAQPSGLSLGGSQVFFADSEASAIRVLSLPDGNVETLAGAGLFAWGHRDGALAEARLQHPLGIDFHANMLYVADTYNHAIRVIDLGTQRISTLLGPSSQGSCTLEGDGCRQLDLFEPGDVKYWNQGLWIADTGNHLIRWLDLAGGQLYNLEKE